jgi:hypothetical protein
MNGITVLAVQEKPQSDTQDELFTLRSIAEIFKKKICH